MSRSAGRAAGCSASRHSVAFLLALEAVGCVETSRRLTASVDEYAAYRRYRMAGTEEAKMAASFQYLDENPAGVWRGEVRGWLSGAEDAYVRRAWNSHAKLKAFLAAVPRGASAERAAARVAELERDEERRRAKARELEERIRRSQRRLEEAARLRAEALHAVQAWAVRIAGIREWGGRTHELDHELIYEFRMVEPAARCRDARCTKTISMRYRIPEARALASREATFDVTLVLEKGAVSGASLSGPELWSRLGEIVNLRPVHPSDSRARMEALGRAVQVMAFAVEQAFPAERCAREAISPVLIERECDGVRLRMIAAVEAAEEDRLVVEPSSSDDGNHAQ